MCIQCNHHPQSCSPPHPQFNMHTHSSTHPKHPCNIPKQVHPQSPQPQRCTWWYSDTTIHISTQSCHWPPLHHCCHPISIITSPVSSQTCQSHTVIPTFPVWSKVITYDRYTIDYTKRVELIPAQNVHHDMLPSIVQPVLTRQVQPIRRWNMACIYASPSITLSNLPNTPSSSPLYIGQDWT